MTLGGVELTVTEGAPGIWSGSLAGVGFFFGIVTAVEEDATCDAPNLRSWVREFEVDGISEGLATLVCVGSPVGIFSSNC